jgi:hypothetical protein
MLLTDYLPTFLHIYMIAGLLILLYWSGSIFVARKNNESKLTNLFLA